MCGSTSSIYNITIDHLQKKYYKAHAQCTQPLCAAAVNRVIVCRKKMLTQSARTFAEKKIFYIYKTDLCTDHTIFVMEIKMSVCAEIMSMLVGALALTRCILNYF